MVSILALMLIWIIVPLLALALLIFSRMIVSAVPPGERKISAEAGFWAGFVFLIVYVVAQLRTVIATPFELASLLSLQWLPLGIGVVAGFLFLWTTRYLFVTRYIGISTFLLCSTSTTFLFTYIFIPLLRSDILFWYLGVVLGMLIHIIFFPSTVALLRPRRRERSSVAPTSPSPPSINL